MPKIVDHAAQRARILEGAFEYFARQGYAALTMRQLARELEISTGTLYHYFPTKEAIFEEMFAFMSRRIVEEALVGVRSEQCTSRRPRPIQTHSVISFLISVNVFFHMKKNIV